MSSKTKKSSKRPPRSIAQMEPLFGSREANELKRYMTSGGWVTEFQKTREFEERVCKFTGARYAFCVNNGTVALSVALLALDIRPGDEVIVPDLTMIATATAVKLIGAKPVFVDVEPASLSLDAEKIIPAITSRTKAVIAVSFNGRSCNLDDIKRVCRLRNLHLVEDAAQALGSYFKGRHFGTIGDLGIFSFSSQKIISTGQGGMVVTQDSRLAERVKRLKDFGRLSGGNDVHDEIGYNFKFTDIQAVIGIEQMKQLPSRIERKRKIYKRYADQLRSMKAIQRLKTDLKSTTPWFIDIYLDDPDALMTFLKSKGIGTRRIYAPIHAQKAFHVSGSFPVTEDYSRRGLWLPSSVQLQDRTIDYICDTIKEYF